MESERPKVLLTGGSGFIASHILTQLLHHSYSVVVTVRSTEKAAGIISSLPDDQRPHVSCAIVEDVAADGAFDKVLSAGHRFDYVVHTASPYSFKVEDPVRDFLDPAIKGTTGILKSVKNHAPTVKRVVITSSSAAIINPKKHEKVYDESKWSPITWDDALQPQFTYPGSKVLAEKAAWSFVDELQPTFDLATINNTYTFGPVQPQLPSLDAMNTSNLRIRDLVLGRMRERLEPTFPVFTWVDVRDVALAHVRAMTATLDGSGALAGDHDASGGKKGRFYVVAGHFSNKQLAEAIRHSHPELADRLPSEESEDDLPADVYQFDNTRSREVLGLEYVDLQTSVADTVDSILEWQRRHGAT